MINVFDWNPCAWEICLQNDHKIIGLSKSIILKISKSIPRHIRMLTSLDKDAYF